MPNREQRRHPEEAEVEETEATIKVPTFNIEIRQAEGGAVAFLKQGETPLAAVPFSLEFAAFLGALLAQAQQTVAGRAQRDAKLFGPNGEPLV